MFVANFELARGMDARVKYQFCEVIGKLTQKNNGLI